VQVQVFTDQTIDTTLGNGTLAQLPASPTFVYNKLQSDTILKITYQDTFYNQVGPGNVSVCTYQLRVDGLASTPAWGPPYMHVGNVLNSTIASSGIFTGLSAGPHVLSFWHSQINSTMCIRNSGGNLTVVTVEEIKVGQ